MELDFELSDEQLDEFARELYFGCNLIADIKKCISHNSKEYTEFLKKERGDAIECD